MITDLTESLKLAAKILSVRDVSVRELTDRLIKKKVEVGLVSETIDYLCEKNWYNEFNCAMEIARTRLRRSPVGGVLMTDYLLAKRFPEQLVERVVDKVYREKSEIFFAEQIVKKRISSLFKKFNGDKKRINSFLSGYLISRGFPEHICEDIPAFEEYILDRE